MAIPAFTTNQPRGPQNVYVIGYSEGEGQLIIDYARDPKKFQLLDYVTVIPVSHMEGLYPKFLAEDYIRSVTTDGSDKEWADGDPMPDTKYQGPRFTNVRYSLKRQVEYLFCGYQTRDQSDFDEVKIKQAACASILMTNRTARAIAQLLSTANWPTTNYNPINSINGGAGFWSAGTVNVPTIMPTLQAVRDQILWGTNNKVKLDDLRLILSPTAASTMSRSQEIRAYLSNTAVSGAVISGENPNAADNWQLPDKLYGFKVIVETTPIVNTKVSSTTAATPSYAMDSNTAVVVARPGGLVSTAGGINFSTMAVFERKEYQMKPFVYDEPQNERLRVGVQDTYVPQVIAPESGYLLQNLFY